MNKRLFCLSIVLIFILTSSSDAQWVRVFQNWAQINAFGQRGSTIFAATYNGLLFSTDFGTNWQRVLPVTHFTVFALTVDDSVVYVGTDGGLLRSAQTDTTWAYVYPPTVNVKSILVHHTPLSGSTLLMGTWRLGVFRSTDNGSTWTYSGLGGSAMYDLGWSINYLAQDSQVIYAGSFFQGVCRSGDDGQGWTGYSTAQTGMMDLGITGIVANGGYVFASTGQGTSPAKGVFRSSDHGANWSKSSDGLTNLNVLSLAVNESRLLAGTGQGGVFLSTNNGDTWAPISTGLPNDDICALIVASDLTGAKYLIAGTASNGIWRRPLSEIVSVPEEHQLPMKIVLAQNYPNPFNPSTTIQYDLSRTGHVSLKVFNILGQIVSTLVNKTESAGVHEVSWNAVNVPTGIYFYRLQAEDFVETKSVVLLK